MSNSATLNWHLQECSLLFCDTRKIPLYQQQFNTENRKVSDLYLTVSRLESRTVYRLYREGVLWIFSVPMSKCHGSPLYLATTFVFPRPFPSTRAHPIIRRYSMIYDNVVP